MKLSFKNKSQNSASSTTAVLLCLYMLSSCGLGTEVGNGAKEDEKKKTGAKASNEAGSDDGQNESMNPENGQNKQDSDVKGPTAYGIDMAIIFNSCGSPFELFYKMPFTLSGTIKSGSKVKLNGEFNAALNTVVISDSSKNALAHIKDDITVGDHKVVVTKKDNSTYPSPYVCSEVVETDEAGIYSYSVILTPVNSEEMTDKSKAENKLSWTVDKTQSTPALTSISVSSEEVELLKLETDSE